MDGPLFPAFDREPLRPARPDDWLGVFDSGLGGLAIVRHMLFALPAERIFYFGDNLHMPYGPRTPDDIRDLCLRIAGHLFRLPAKVVVIACNTASAAALAFLRERFPDRLFVGMEPAVKPAVSGTDSGKIAVLATPGTVAGEPFRRLRERFGDRAEIFSQPCPGLAEAIERHGPEHPEVEELVGRFVRPLLPEGVDRLVLACTHYSLAIPVFRRVAGDAVWVVDPSPAIAARVLQVVTENGLAAGGGPGDGRLTVAASGEVEDFSRTASVFLERAVRAERVDFFGERHGPIRPMKQV